MRRRNMAKKWAKAFYNSSKWRKCRDAYIQYRMLIDGGICEECKEEPGYIVHHEVILDSENIRDPEIALNHKRMKYVCKKCHDKYEGHGVGHGKMKPLCTFDEHGKPISMRDIDKKIPETD